MEARTVQRSSLDSFVKDGRSINGLVDFTVELQEHKQVNTGTHRYTHTGTHRYTQVHTGTHRYTHTGTHR